MPADGELVRKIKLEHARGKALCDRTETNHERLVTKLAAAGVGPAVCQYIGRTQRTVVAGVRKDLAILEALEILLTTNEERAAQRLVDTITTPVDHYLL